MVNQVSILNFKFLQKLIFFLILGAGIGVSALAPRNKSQIGEGVAEHIFKIEIDEVLVEDDAYLQVQESFEWDLSNPDNSPDEVAN